MDEAATTEEFSVVRQEGKRQVKRDITFYSLEAIIAVGYRVNSTRGTQFRTWATEKLKNYILKGFAIDADRFKYGTRFDARYFEELLEEIREIRASERMVYQKITDIYATAVDYSPNSVETERFFATVQNKMHYAITGKTAAEIILERADKNKPNMGLTTWRKAPKGKILKSDISIAKNYLQKEGNRGNRDRQENTLGGGLASSLFCRKFTNLHAPRTIFEDDLPENLFAYT